MGCGLSGGRATTQVICDIADGAPPSSPLRSIKQLTKLIGAHAPDAIKTQEMAAYTGRKLAIDASMAIYQFLVRAEVAERGGARNTPSGGGARGAVPSPLTRAPSPVRWRCALATARAGRRSS